MPALVPFTLCITVALIHTTCRRLSVTWQSLSLIVCIHGNMLGSVPSPASDGSALQIWIFYSGQTQWVGLDHGLGPARIQLQFKHICPVSVSAVWTL